MIGLSLALFLLITCILVAYLIFKEKNVYWIVGLGILICVLEFSLIPFILNILGIPFKDNAFTIIGIEGVTNLVIDAILGAIKLHSKNPPFYPLVDKQLSKNLFLIILLLVFLISLPIVLIINNFRYGFTEFYFVEANYDVSAWRKTYSYADSIPLVVDINNHELGTEDYSIIVQANGKTINEIELGFMNPGENKVQSVILPPMADELTEYQFFLYKNDIRNSFPYRILTIWIVRKPT